MYSKAQLKIMFFLHGLLPSNANFFHSHMNCQTSALPAKHRYHISPEKFAPCKLLHSIKNVIPKNTLLHKCLIFFPISDFKHRYFIKGHNDSELQAVKINKQINKGWDKHHLTPWTIRMWLTKHKSGFNNSCFLKLKSCSGAETHIFQDSPNEPIISVSFSHQQLKAQTYQVTWNGLTSPGLRIMWQQSTSIQILWIKRHHVHQQRSNHLSMLIPGGSTNANKDEQFQSVNVDACYNGEVFPLVRWGAKLFCLWANARLTTKLNSSRGIKDFKGPKSLSIQFWFCWMATTHQFSLFINNSCCEPLLT